MVLLSGCAMDNVFLYPERMADDTDSIWLYDAEVRKQILLTLDSDLQPENPPLFYPGTAAPFRLTSTWVESNSGNRLYAWHMTPDSANGMSILFFHGNAGNITSHFPLMVPMVNRGFDVFLFDYSGYGFSEGEASREAVLLDGRAAMDHVLAHREEFADTLILYGQSLGGHLAATLASEYNDALSALVIEGAFASHDDIANAKSPLGLGSSLVKEQYAGKDRIGAFSKPVLVTHSPDDRVIPISQGQALFEHANEPKSFFEISGPHVNGPILYGDSITHRIQRMVRTQSM